MKDPSNSTMTTFGNPAGTFRVPAHHRRAHSEVNFRLPKGLDLVSDPFNGPWGSLDEIGSEDELFCTYMDMENLRSSFADGIDKLAELWAIDPKLTHLSAKVDFGKKSTAPPLCLSLMFLEHKER